VVRQTLENLAEMDMVRVHVRAGHEQVIDIDKAEWQPTQHLIHKTLQRLCSIAETKRHAYELEEPERSDHGCLWDVLVGDWDLVIRSDEVDLGENSAAV
jgi:hypothetical protein